MRTLYEVAKQLNLSPEEFRRLVDDGILDDHRLDESCLQKVPAAYLAEARYKRPTEH